MALTPRLIVRLPAPAFRGEGAIPVRVDANWLDPVRFVATSGALASFTAGSTYAGLTLASGDRFLYQPMSGLASTPGVTNGIYVVGAGAPTRASDADIGAEIFHAAVLVLAGTPGAGQTWIDVNSTAPVVGTDTITFRPISAAGGDATALDKWQFETRTEAAAASIKAAHTVLETEAFATVGDQGGARYKKVGSAPSHPGKFQSADGAWWEIDEQELDPRMFGAVASTTVDQQPALQAWLDCCSALDATPMVRKPLECRIDSALSYIPNSGSLGDTNYKSRRCDMRLLLLRPSFDGGITLGSASPTALWTRAQIQCPSLNRLGTVTWGADNSASRLSNQAGLILRNLAHCVVDYPQECRGFTIGVALQGEGNLGAVCYTTFRGGHLVDNRYQEVIRSMGTNAFVNENSFWGGRRGCSSLTLTLGDAYGTVMCAQAGGYIGHNLNRWYSPCYEMQAPAGATYRVPVLLDGAGGRNVWQFPRYETGKGPFGIAIGKTGSEFGAAYKNKIITGVLTAVTGTGYGAGWLQVNGARGNMVQDLYYPDPQWNSGPLVRHVSSGGTAATPRIAAPFFIRRSTIATSSREGAAATDFTTNINGLQSVSSSAGLLIELDSSSIKQWTIHRAYQTGFHGRIFLGAVSATGTVLTSTTTDSWGTEAYVKGDTNVLAETTLYGGGWSYSADKCEPIMVTLRDEVKKLLVGFSGATNPLVLKGITIIAHGAETTPFTSLLGDGWSGIGIGAPLLDTGTDRLATARPDTAGAHGQYFQGEIVGNKSAATGGTQPAGWVCTTAGYLAVAWAISTAYKAIGHVVTNDSGKMYALTTAGTSAASGGPTGTGTGITDGTCVWDYIGVKAVFAALANVT